MISSVVIIGAGLAGVTAARTLRSEGYEGRIHLIGKEFTNAYDRPSLSKSVLSGKHELPPSLVDSSWYEKAKIDLHLGESVSNIDYKNQTVQLESCGSLIKYDRLLLATGSHARKSIIEGVDLDGVFYLRNLGESLNMREAIHPGKSLVIIGGGLIGCEVATTARLAGLDVTILETANELLWRVLGRETGAWCRSQLEKLGIKVGLNSEVSQIEGNHSVSEVICADGNRFPCDLVLISIGAEPTDALACTTGIDCDRGIKVDSSGKTSHKNIYAAGDVALWPSFKGRNRSFQTYINSQKQAEIVACSMLGTAFESPQISSSWTEIAGHRIQMLGDIEGQGEQVIRGEWSDTCSLCLFRIYDDRIEAVIAINMPKEYSIASRLLTSGVRVSKKEIQDTSINLRSLLNNK